MSPTDEVSEEVINPFADYRQSSEFKALVWVLRCSGALSMIGSVSIIYSLLRYRKMLWFQESGKRSTTGTYILLLISICDFLSSSVGSFMGTWMTPVSIAGQSSGNTASCTTQGFFFHAFAQVASFYNVMQALYYVLTVCHKIKEESFQKPLLKFTFLWLPFVSMIGFNIWPLVDGAFSYSQRAVCSYEPYPLGCKKTGTCTRGDSANTIRLVNTIFIMVCAFVIILAVSKLYWFVLKTERALDKYNVQGLESVTRTQSKKVALQGIYYAGCFLATYLLWIVFSIRKFLGLPMLYWLLVCIHIFVPLQGFLNAFVYYRVNVDEVPLRNSVASTMNLVRASILVTIGGFGSRELDSNYNSQSQGNNIATSSQDLDRRDLESNSES